jgi:hypothetical protein
LAAMPLVFVAACGGSTGATKTTPSVSASTSAASQGNGIANLSVKNILQRAGKASIAAGSVRIHGRARDKGQVFGMDLRIAGRKAGAGTIVTHGQRIGVIRLGSTAYIKGDAKFWQAAGGQAAARMFVGKYLKTKADNKDFADMTSFTIMSKMFAEMLKPVGTPTKGERAQINGTPAIALVDGDGGKLYVATEGKPYVLRAASKDGKDQLDFTGYGQAFTIQRPPTKLVIDIDKIG